MGRKTFDTEHDLELGPGHYEFCEYVKSKGGRASVVELDPCVAELGRWRGFGGYEHDLRALGDFRVETVFDGLFSKGSTNPFWCHPDRESLERYVDALVRLVKPDGWLWVVSCPWSAKELSEAQFMQWLEFERRLFEARGFKAWRIPNRYVGSFYGISVPCEDLHVFSRGLPPFRLTSRSLFRMFAWSIERAAAKLVR